MNYSKIVHKNQAYRDVVLQDLNELSEKPLMVLAGRFSVHRIKIKNQREFDKKVMFLIQGNKIKNEKCIVTFERNSAYDLVEKVTLQRSTKFDGQLCSLLKLSLIMRFIDLKTYYFGAKVLNEL